MSHDSVRLTDSAICCPGTKFMTDDEAQSTGEFQMRHSHATHDLFNAIADGDFPEYDFYIQTLDPADELSLEFDPLDCTKVGHLPQFPAPSCMIITGCVPGHVAHHVPCRTQRLLGSIVWRHTPR